MGDTRRPPGFALPTVASRRHEPIRISASRATRTPATPKHMTEAVAQVFSAMTVIRSVLAALNSAFDTWTKPVEVLVLLDMLKHGGGC